MWSLTESINFQITVKIMQKTVYQFVLVFQGTWKTNQRKQGEDEEQAFGAAGNSQYTAWG